MLKPFCVRQPALVWPIRKIKLSKPLLDSTPAAVIMDVRYLGQVERAARRQGVAAASRQLTPAALQAGLQAHLQGEPDDAAVFCTLLAHLLQRLTEQAY